MWWHHLAGVLVMMALGPGCTDLTKGVPKEIVETQLNCSNECKEQGAAECASDIQIRYCVQASSGCLAWSGAIPCDEQNLCLVQASCDTGRCVGMEKNCNDGNPCTDDWCEEDTGNCSHQPNLAGCDDGNPCTQVDRCQQEICQGTDCDCGNNAFRVSDGSAQAASPTVGISPDGSILVAWQEEGVDGDGYGIAARLLDNQGCPASPTWIMNKHTALNQTLPDLAFIDNTKVAAVWQSDGQDGAGMGVFGRVLRTDGLAVTDDFQIDDQSAGEQLQASLVALDGGSFVVFWKLAAGTNWPAYARRFNALGLPQSAPVEMGLMRNNGMRIQVANITDDRLVLVWDGGTNPNFEVQYRCLSPSLEFVSEEKIANAYYGKNSYMQHLGVVAPLLTTGGFVVAWDDGSSGASGLDGSLTGVYGRTFNNDCQPVQTVDHKVNEFVAGVQGSPLAIGLDGGKFAVLWFAQEVDLSILGRVFTSDFETVGPVFQVTTKPSAEAAAAPLPEGGFIVAWRQDGPEKWEIHARIYRELP